MNKGEQIEQLYQSSFKGPFPYDDCRWFAHQIHKPSADVIPEIDWYFSSIAGYGSSASRLSRRTPEELRNAKNFLAKDFFHHFPDLEPHRGLLDNENTPRMHQRLVAAEQIRLGLLAMIAESSDCE